MSAQEILEENGLDFNISKRALSDDDSNPSGFFGLWNDEANKCLHTVKGGYHVSQTRDVVELALAGIKKFDGVLSVKMGGAINDGRKIFLQLKLEGDSKINGDTIVQFITILDSNDGTTSLSIGIGDLTMSCRNQFHKFYKEADTRIRHSSSLEEKMLIIPSLIEEALGECFKQMELYRELDRTPFVGYDIVHEMVNQVLGYDNHYTSVMDLAKKSTRSINQMNALYEAIDSEVSDKGVNLWGLHSGVTKYTTHLLSAPKRTNGRIEKIMLGGGYKMNQVSLEFVKSKVLELV